MIIKIMLTTPIVLLMCYVMIQRVSTSPLRWLFVVTLLVGAYFVWFPDAANRLANLIGVGRGADLLVYFWVIVTLALLLLFYLRFVQLQRVITILAREISLLSPSYPKEDSR